MYLELTEPLLTIVSFLLAECKLDEVSVTVLGGSEWNHVFFHFAKVVAGVLVLTGTQTL
jgi:hypothetical protein